MKAITTAPVLALLLGLGAIGPATAQSYEIPCSPITNGGCTAYSATNPVPTTVVPSSTAANGITPVVSASAESSHVLKATAGAVYGVYATNLTATSGFLVVINATSAPVDGAITPLACVPLPANGNASINYNPGPAGVYGTGITAVVTSATSCFTKTTGVITAFISGSVQ